MFLGVRHRRARCPGLTATRPPLAAANPFPFLLARPAPPSGGAGEAVAPLTGGPVGAAPTPRRAAGALKAAPRHYRPFPRLGTGRSRCCCRLSRSSQAFPGAALWPRRAGERGGEVCLCLWARVTACDRKRRPLRAAAAPAGAGTSACRFARGLGRGGEAVPRLPTATRPGCGATRYSGAWPEVAAGSRSA